MRFARAALVSLVAASTFGLAACSETEGGTPEPGGGETSLADVSSAPQTAGSSPGGSLSSLDPCSVLRTEEVAKNGPVANDSPKPETLGGARACTWAGDMNGTAQLVPTTSVVIRENGGVQDMNDLGYGVDQTSEGGRDYGRAAGPNGCAIAIGVTDSSRVDIQVTSVEEAKACEIANQLVEVAEPRVPRG